MVVLKTKREIEQMKKAGKIAANALHLAGRSISPGITTWDLDFMIREYIEKQGAKPSCLGYGGFPNSSCISINNEVVHGIPSKKRKVESGDIVSIDVSAFYNGFHGDTAYTFACGEVSDQARALLNGRHKKSGGWKQNRRYIFNDSRVCRGTQLLGGTRFCRSRSRCEAT